MNKPTIPQALRMQANSVAQIIQYPGGNLENWIAEELSFHILRLLQLAEDIEAEQKKKGAA